MACVEIADEALWPIFSLTDDLTNSYVDPNNLIAANETHSFPIGMSNFRSKNSSSAIAIRRQSVMKTNYNNIDNTRNRIVSRWKIAVLKAKMLHDPWIEFHIENYSAERVIRHRYNAIKKKWMQDECIVKMENQQFANGAMRACYRLYDFFCIMRVINYFLIVFLEKNLVLSLIKIRGIMPQIMLSNVTWIVKYHVKDILMT